MSAQKFNYLIKQIKDNSKALKELYDFYYPRIVIHINGCFCGKLDGRDIAHQFFLKLLKMQIKEYINYPASWVYKTAEYIAIEALRKNGKRKAAEESAAADYKSFDIKEDGTEILKCLGEREQQIMYLRYWEGYKLKEIAEILEINYSTLKSAHNKAKTILRKTIKEEKIKNEKN